MRGIVRGAAAAALILSCAGCFAYRGPRGVEASLEDSLGVELRRDFGVKLGFLSTKFAVSFIGRDDDDLDFHDLTSIGVAVFERGAANGRTPRRIEPGDLGLKGFSTMLRSSDGDDQVLLLVKPSNGTIREMVLLAVDEDEVVVARLTGRLDELIEKAIRETKRNGAAGARAAMSF
jgi:Domain of unknown function (DUF4252)